MRRSGTRYYNHLQASRVARSQVSTLGWRPIEKDLSCLGNKRNSHNDSLVEQPGHLGGRAESSKVRRSATARRSILSGDLSSRSVEISCKDGGMGVWSRAGSELSGEILNLGRTAKPTAMRST
jgi:hypothetical protein